jgi:hypothetical protein
VELIIQWIPSRHRFLSTAFLSLNTSFYLTPWIIVLPEKLIVAHMAKEFPPFVKPCSQEPTIGHYPKPDESNPHPHTVILNDQFCVIVSSHLRLGLPSDLFPSVFPIKFFCIYFYLSHAFYMPIKSGTLKLP